MKYKVTRATFDKGVALTGVLLVLSQLLLLAYSPIHVAAVVLGVLMIYVGIWRLVSHMLPNRRIYMPLREEVDEFIRLVRRLNTERTKGDFPAAFETGAELRETVERVIAVAGVEKEPGNGTEAELQRQTMGSA
ncbi:MAG: hypothetical protein JSW46_12750 [Gemmatimonadota bacterium]|nr:MAG: hypothetical protein JSW46_12750 [Gemmatimonadota bacterium]